MVEVGVGKMDKITSFRYCADGRNAVTLQREKKTSYGVCLHEFLYS